MLEQVRKYIKQHEMLSDGSRVLVALSGGADSVVLLDMLTRLGYGTVAAHCNFHLRGEEADHDMRFVQEHCRTHNVPLLIKHFNTASYAAEYKVSVEVAAREQRYAWFAEMSAQEHCGAIAVAHHKNDQAETVLHNIIRGAGLKGMRGMMPKNGMVIRPLMCLTRGQIEQYADEHGLKFVTDSTNNEDNYQRNRIRHRLLPELEKLNPDIVDTLCRNADNARSQWELLCQLSNELRAVSERQGQMAINKAVIMSHSPALLHLLLEPYGFSPQNISQFYGCLHETESKRIVSGTHTAITARDEILVFHNGTPLLGCRTYEIKVSYLNREKLPSLQPPTPWTAYFDADLLPESLAIRQVENGDRFRPLGMKGSKKVHDYLTDHKISASERIGTRVLTDSENGKIVWLVPHRISADYAVNHNTKRVAAVSIN